SGQAPEEERHPREQREWRRSRAAADRAGEPTAAGPNDFLRWGLAGVVAGDAAGDWIEAALRRAGAGHAGARIGDAAGVEAAGGGGAGHAAACCFDARCVADPCAGVACPGTTECRLNPIACGITCDDSGQAPAEKIVGAGGGGFACTIGGRARPAPFALLSWMALLLGRLTR